MWLLLWAVSPGSNLGPLGALVLSGEYETTLTHGEKPPLCR